jgi:hypothetical protein
VWPVELRISSRKCVYVLQALLVWLRIEGVRWSQEFEVLVDQGEMHKSHEEVVSDQKDYYFGLCYHPSRVNVMIYT